MMKKASYSPVLIILSVFCLVFMSCEEVIRIDLNSADPAFVAEAVISKDSVCQVRLTMTAGYFSAEEPEGIEGAVIRLLAEGQKDHLVYLGNGFYTGDSIIGTEGSDYKIEIGYNGKLYEGNSHMPGRTEIISLTCSKNNDRTVFNPEGKTMYVVDCEFLDEPGVENYYMVRYLLDGKPLAGSLYLITEQNSTNGDLSVSGLNRADADTIRFSEWMFYDGGEVVIEVYSVDRSIYDYFVQLNDILYWKRRIMPPSPYNPVSNLTNGALGFFAAWSVTSRKIILD